MYKQILPLEFLVYKEQKCTRNHFKQKMIVCRVLGCSQDLQRLETQAGEGQEAEQCGFSGRCDCAQP